MDIEVLTWRDLVARLGSPARARRAVAAGEWTRILRNAYVAGEHEDTAAVRAAAVGLVLPPGVALSHRAALWVLGIDVLGAQQLLDVTTPRGRHLRPRSGLVVHIAEVSDEELCEVGGLLAVSAARAFVDVARSEDLTEAVAFGDAVLRSGAATVEQFEVSLTRASGLRGIRAARDVVPHLEPRSESLMESRLRMKLVRGGLPRPEAQFDMYDAEGEHCGRGDLHLDGVVLEYDGREARLSKERFVADRRRRSRIAELGVEVREFTGADVYARSDASVCAEVLRAVRIAASRDRSALRQGPDTLRPPRLRPLPTRADASVARAA